jgi:CubicO group peptidase (beta-lactamase class C family)
MFSTLGARGLALAVLTLRIATPAAAEEGLTQRVDAYLAPFVEAGHLSGSVLLAKGDDVLYERSFGLANRELEVPVSYDTRFCVASITKPMTQIVALRLIEAGVLAPSDKVSKWISGFPRGDEITVEMLLRHQAGIPHRVTTEEQEALALDAADMVELVKAADPLFEPGTSESYSSAGYSVVARILELASGRSYSELVAEHVFGPAGMTSSHEPVGNELIPLRASSYQFATRGEIENTPLKSSTFLVGAGSVFSTPRDLLKLMRTVVSGGYGPLVTENLVREGRLSWNGRTGGYRAFADYHPAGDVYAAFAGNILTGAGDMMRRDLPVLARGEAVETPVIPAHEAVAVDPTLLSRYEGDYELRPGSPLTLTVEDGEVRMSGWLLIPTSERTFFSPQDYGEITVVLDAEGEVERLDWKQGGQTYPMPKVD